MLARCQIVVGAHGLEAPGCQSPGCGLAAWRTPAGCGVRHLVPVSPRGSCSLAKVWLAWFPIHSTFRRREVARLLDWIVAGWFRLIPFSRCPVVVVSRWLVACIGQMLVRFLRESVRVPAESVVLPADIFLPLLCHVGFTEQGSGVPRTYALCFPGFVGPPVEVGSTAEFGGPAKVG